MYYYEGYETSDPTEIEKIKRESERNFDIAAQAAADNFMKKNYGSSYKFFYNTYEEKYGEYCVKNFNFGKTILPIRFHQILYETETREDITGYTTGYTGTISSNGNIDIKENSSVDIKKVKYLKIIRSRDVDTYIYLYHYSMKRSNNYSDIEKKIKWIYNREDTSKRVEKELSRHNRLRNPNILILLVFIFQLISFVCSTPLTIFSSINVFKYVEVNKSINNTLSINIFIISGVYLFCFLASFLFEKIKRKKFKESYYPDYYVKNYLFSSIAVLLSLSIVFIANFIDFDKYSFVRWIVIGLIGAAGVLTIFSVYFYVRNLFEEHLVEFKNHLKDAWFFKHNGKKKIEEKIKEIKDAQIYHYGEVYNLPKNEVEFKTNINYDNLKKEKVWMIDSESVKKLDNQEYSKVLNIVAKYYGINSYDAIKYLEQSKPIDTDLLEKIEEYRRSIRFTNTKTGETRNVPVVKETDNIIELEKVEEKTNDGLSKLYNSAKEQFEKFNMLNFETRGNFEYVLYNEKIIAKLYKDVAKQNVKILFALEPSKYDKEKYKHQDISNKNGHQNTPLMFIFREETQISLVIELILESIKTHLNN